MKNLKFVFMSQDQKRESIIEAARKRFVHFGVDKTTMNEIADDLAISKASLYYYFPDKLNLYAAVLQKIIGDEEGEEIPYLNEKDLLKGLKKYLEQRTGFIIKNYRILEYLQNIGLGIPEELRILFTKAKQRDLVIISAFMKKGKDENLLKSKNLKHAAELLHDCLNGLRVAALEGKTNFFPEEQKFYDLLDREKEVVDIFFKGLAS